MKSRTDLIVILLLSCVTSIAVAQSSPTEDAELVPIPGSDLLRDDWERIGPLLNTAQRDESLRVRSLQRAAAWEFSIGSTRNWWATNLTAYTEYAVPSTCRAVGTNCYIFVEDAVWGSRVTQAVVDSLCAAFDDRTPADATKGIYDLTTEYYGVPPNVDNDPKIIILVLNIVDGFSGSGSYVAGYFYSINEYSEAVVQAALGSNRHSNEAEIYYLDANPANLMTSSGLAAGTATTAHEFQHMIHFNYDTNEITFVNEGMSETASVLCGYALRTPSYFFANTDIAFLNWGSTGNVLDDYSRTALFSWYIIEQHGSAVTKDIVARPENGVAGYNAALQLHSSPRLFVDMLGDFGVAVQLNDTNVDPRFGFFRNIPGAPTPHRSHATNIVPSRTDAIQPYGTRYIRFAQSAPLCFTCTWTDSLTVRAILTGPAARDVDTVLSGVPLYASLEATYDTVIIAITNLSASANEYTYAATQDVLPVQLSAFEVSVVESDILLLWRTETEVDNLGFVIERRMIAPNEREWEEIAFVPGAGTSNQPIDYSYTDHSLAVGRYVYRLRQLDRTGSFWYSSVFEIELTAPSSIELMQNYPNPFNPTTQIRVRISERGAATLSIYDLLGREVAVLLNGEYPPGPHVVTWNAAGLESGVYLCRLNAGGFTQARKVVLLK